MSYNYAGVKSTADTLIKKFGQAVTFYKVARGLSLSMWSTGGWLRHVPRRGCFASSVCV